MARYHVLPLSFSGESRRSWKAVMSASIAVLSLGAVIAMSIHTQTLIVNATQEWEERNAEQQRARVKGQPTADQMKAREREMAVLAAVEAALSVPWNELFHEFEVDSGPDVTLLAIEPDVETGAVELTAESRNLEAMSAYNAHLAASARFDNVFVKQHEVLASDPQKPIRFVMSLRWRARSESSKGKA